MINYIRMQNINYNLVIPAPVAAETPQLQLPGKLQNPASNLQPTINGNFVLYNMEHAYSIFDINVTGLTLRTVSNTYTTIVETILCTNVVLPEPAIPSTIIQVGFFLCVLAFCASVASDFKLSSSPHLNPSK
ncbi:hypothetical protein V1477_014350 [Vespula maculifrons]|uniref:Uncharacterized protein n=1 Tax=Vespula maculifrons TaxID=7453 RepID=A0ABD2BKU1_VESMC